MSAGERANAVRPYESNEVGGGGGGLCDGCRYLAYGRWPDRWAALCCDKDKPVLGARRVLITMEKVRPTYIGCPAWCRGKESGA